MSNDIYSDLFIDNLPESLTWDSQVQSIGMVSDTQAVGLQKFLPQLLVLCNIQNLPESTLDLLAFQFSVLFWSQLNNITDPVQRLAMKRMVIANNYNFYGHLGTPNTVQTIASAIFGPAVVQEWFLYGGAANHFRVLTPSVIDPATQTEMLSLITIVKRASQAMDGFFLYSGAPTGFYVAVVVFTQMWLFLPMPKQSVGIQYVNLGMSIVASATVHRSSAVAQMSTGLSMTASARQLSAGAMVCDIRIGMQVNPIARAMIRATALIYTGGILTTPV